jgi:predicted Zn-dependent protease
VNKLKSYIAAFFPGVRVDVEPNIPEFATLSHMERVRSVQSRIPQDKKRKQFHAGNIVETIVRDSFKPAADECFFVLTDADIFPEKEWVYVFGVTFAQMSTVIASIARLDPRFPDRSTVNGRESETAVDHYKMG